MFTIKGKYTTADVMIDNIEPECLAQITAMCNNKVFINPIKIMPDTHSGKGSVIGFTMKLGDKIIPNIVGVDIGCGMLSFCIGNIDIDVADLDKKIREKIPFGMNWHNKNSEQYKKNLEVCKKILDEYYEISD
jgi:tRNA-splicing ligase RtcB (3'-phosphate/5'-hydroxy nucleic acid ligase)